MSPPSAVSPNLSIHRGISTTQDEVPLDVSQGLENAGLSIIIVLHVYTESWLIAGDCVPYFIAVLRVGRHGSGENRPRKCRGLPRTMCKSTAEVGRHFRRGN